MPGKVETKPVVAVVDEANADAVAAKRVKPTHPTYFEMIIIAIKSLSDRKGIFHVKNLLQSKKTIINSSNQKL